MVVHLPQRRGIGIHVCAKGRWIAVHSMADSAVVTVDFGACHKAVLINLDGRGLDEFPINALVQRDSCEQPLFRKRMVGYGDWNSAKPEPGQYGYRYKNHSD
jgi:hypothetical protein